MEIISYSTAREELAATMDKVVADHSPILITRIGSASVVMLSLADYESMEETAYLMSSPANAQRLIESIHALENGQRITRGAATLLDE